MLLLEETCPTPEQNLALDEWLLDDAERAGTPRETLRLWEPAKPMVVVGRSSSTEDEVHLQACREHNIPVLRRASGGAAIVTGPGCLMFAVVLSYQLRPELRAIDRAHRFVMERLCNSLGPRCADIAWQGTCDLTWRGRKFSGNALRCRREHLIYHGTLLYRFELDWVETCLKFPRRTPDYRQGRPHRDFVANLPLSRPELWAGVKRAFPTDDDMRRVDYGAVDQLVAEKYAREEWNRRA